ELHDRKRRQVRQIVEDHLIPHRRLYADLDDFLDQDETDSLRSLVTQDAQDFRLKLTKFLWRFDRPDGQVLPFLVGLGSRRHTADVEKAAPHVVDAVRLLEAVLD